MIMTACRVMLLTWLLTGLGYPLTVTVLGQFFYKPVAVGRLVAMPVRDAALLQPRPSWQNTSWKANLAPNNPQLFAQMQNIAKGKTEQSLDMLQLSASGVDPDISKAAAEAQLPRLAAARKLTMRSLKQLLNDNSINSDDLVNVSCFNQALSSLSP